MRTNGHGKPVVALDIDGTLGDYHSHFIGFCKLYFGREFPNPDQINPSQHFSDFLRLSKPEYREAKLAYRQGGWKRWMPAYPGASTLTREIRRMEAEVWICTTRPYLRLDSIDPDTREWLRRNNIEYDAVLFDVLSTYTGEEVKGSKYAELARQAGSRVVAVAEDMLDYLRRAEQYWPQSSKVTLILRDQPYNRDEPLTEYSDGWRRAYDCASMFGHIAKAITKYQTTPVPLWTERDPEESNDA